METGHAVDVERVPLPPGVPPAFYPAFGHVLRDELTYRGYELVTVPESGALPVTVAASETNGANEKGAKTFGYRELDVALVKTEKTPGPGNSFLSPITIRSCRPTIQDRTWWCPESKKKKKR